MRRRARFLGVYKPAYDPNYTGKYLYQDVIRPFQRAENIPQAQTDEPGKKKGPGPGGAPVVLPGFGGQCSVFGYQKDAAGNRINLQVAMPGGYQRTFATEAEFQAACGGGAPMQQAAPVYAQPVPSQAININLPASAAPQVQDSGLTTALMYEMARRNAEYEEMLRRQRETGGPLPVSQPQQAQQAATTWLTSASQQGTGITEGMTLSAEPPAGDAPPQAQPPQSWWLWVLMGIGAVYSMKGKGL